ncbi:MAG: AbrB/MazE/SpoVT family DNA-binding domain-containing protein [Promethearchaeota archaeon]|jgi:phosphate uptake regulator
MEQIYRKLQKIGGSLVVSLPKKWTENYHLAAGSSIAIEVLNNGTLSISPKFTIKEKVDTEELVLESNSYVVWELLKSSLSGQTKIVIASDKEINKSLRNDVRYFVGGLPNTEITEEGKHRIVIQNFGYKKIPTKQLIQRLLYLVANMFEDLRDKSLEDLKYNYQQLRKFYFILVIHIRTYLRTGVYVSDDSDFTPLEAMDYRMFCEKIEEIGEILRDFQLTEAILDFYNETFQYFNEIMDAFLKKDDKLAYYAWLKKDWLFVKSEEFSEGLEHEDKDNVNVLLRIIQNCKDMAALI